MRQVKRVSIDRSCTTSTYEDFVGVDNSGGSIIQGIKKINHTKPRNKIIMKEKKEEKPSKPIDFIIGLGIAGAIGYAFYYMFSLISI